MLSIFLLNITPAGQGTGQCPANCCPIIRSLPISSVLISFAVSENCCLKHTLLFKQFDCFFLHQFLEVAFRLVYSDVEVVVVLVCRQ